jgi:hypothetical protein
MVLYVLILLSVWSRESSSNHLYLTQGATFFCTLAIDCANRCGPVMMSRQGKLHFALYKKL